MSIRINNTLENNLLKIFITGGSGFLGQRLIETLDQQGHTITALSRSTNSDAILERPGITLLRGSLQNIDAWAGSLSGQDAVIHAASPIDVWGSWATFASDVVEATIKLYRASGICGVKRFIYISSESVMQRGQSLLDIDETYSYPKAPNSMYGKAKHLAETALLDASSATEIIIIRPSFIWGKDDKQLETIAGRIRRRQFMWIDHGQALMEMVHVANVVEAIRLALTKGKPGNIYLVTDDRPMVSKIFLTALLQTRAVQPPTTSIPSALARPLATLVEGIWRLFRLKAAPPISQFQLDFIGLPRRYDLDKIKHDLGYKPIYSFEMGLAEMAGAN